jgi:M6 family metalloprotease-like protein
MPYKVVFSSQLGGYLLSRISISILVLISLFGLGLPAFPSSSQQNLLSGTVSDLEKSNSSISSNFASASNPFLEQFSSGASLNHEQCKLQENSYWRNGVGKPYSGYTGNATAFPFNPTKLPVTGEINVHFVYVDWSDLPGTKKDYNYYKKQVKMFQNFYWMASERKLKMTTTLSKSWFRMTGSYKEFTLTAEQESKRGPAPQKQKFYDAAIAASDKATDYSNADVVFFGIPRAKSVFLRGGPHEFNFDYNASLKTDEGEIFDTATAGDWFLKNDFYEPPWVYYVHETGHMLGIPHQSNEEVKDGRLLHLSSPLGGYDIMANQGGASRTISSWLRWLAGWLDDDQVICTSAEVITDNYFELSPINRVEGKVESLVIRLSDTKAAVVESRRFDKAFDRKTRNSKNGLLVYVVDATKSTAQGSQRLLSPRDITRYIPEPTWRYGSELDAVFFQGDSVVIDGVKIKAHRIGKGTDVVRVSKANQ